MTYRAERSLLPRHAGQWTRCVIAAYVSTALLCGIDSSPVRADEKQPAADNKANLGEPQQEKPKEKKQAKKKPAAEPLALAVDLIAAPAVAGNANVNDAMVAQFVQQYQALLSTELLFVRMLCPDLTVEQRAKVKAAGDASLKDAATRQAKFQQQRQVQVNTRLEPGAIIRAGISEALEEVLSEQELATFKDESAHRAANRKHASIASAVSRLDETLCLTAEQRAKLTEAITDKWQADWEAWLMLPMYGNQYTPMIPDQLVVPHLNAEQKAVWRGLQKINMSGWNVWNGQQIDPEEEAWWNNQPIPAKKQGNNPFKALINSVNGALKLK